MEKNLLLFNTVATVYQKGKIIINGVDECNGLIIVKNGQLRAYYTTAEGKEITLYRLLSSDICIMSASCIIKNIDFSVTLEVEKDSEVLVIPANIWGKLNEANGAVKEFSLQLISLRFSDVMWVMEQIVFKGMDQRLAGFLIEQSSLEESDTLSITHEVIAKNLSTAREVISRLLKYFENEKLVELSRGSLKILDFKGLHKLSG
ncbi:MAG: Crp/Fnr family transcriptional regulator [Clostridiales bacterium 43-6]|nr:MAG: Crp/Fnr family transcriptional regulator [Clostridiales bacterium 43-6]